ncbi:MAG: murein transglycosylase [Burkholderiales bacterium PBB4]|nr:MAG: murein transglycosylase [Burkholderiales bacterium PBB4]
MQRPTRLSKTPLRWRALSLLTMLAVAGCMAAAPTSPVTVQSTELDKERRFSDWVEAFKVSARASGIDEETLRVSFDAVRYIPRVIEQDQRQPEFTRNVWDYLDSAVSAQRVAAGKIKLLQWQPTISPIASRYGVPPEILMAIWGLESSYGSFTGDISTIDALATLGYDGRRGPWARSQLLAALKILQSREFDRAQLMGSWAGAMGQTQFLPSSYLAYAVDADGDGKRDIWGNTADVMASTANFMLQAGWQAGQVWGVEVRLPPGFDFARADTRQTTQAWVKQAVQPLNGAPLPEIPDSAILLPAGARGPAFLVGPNFRAILRYNNSTSYALAVALLAQRLADGRDVIAPWPRDLVAMTRLQLVELQTALNAQDFDCGVPDGVLGPATRGCIRLYQMRQGLPADGYPTVSLLERLQSVAAPKADTLAPSSP